jgi:hypothetical protein
MRKYACALLALVTLGAAAALVGGVSTARAVQPDPLGEFQERLISGNAYTMVANSNTPTPKPKGHHPHGPVACAQKLGSNVQVNQNCLNISDPDLQGRGQAQNETAIAIDPQNPSRIVASYNDYRRGDGTCGSSYSTNKGQAWADSTIPNGFTRGTEFGKAREYWQGGGDTSVAFDTKGNVYLACQLFNRGASVSPNVDLSSAFYVFRSTGNGGASWNFTGRPARVSADPLGTGAAPFEDKEYLTVDNNVGSPYQDRVYVTWTEFTPDGTAYIYEAYSSDYGETFSDPVVVSGDNPTVCDQTYGLPTPHGSCNENQYSDPFVGPDGALYVAYANFNTAVTGNENFNRILLSKSTDGGASFSAPVLVGEYYDLPDCATYQAGQDAGRACVPEKGSTAYSVFRATNYPSGAADPTNPNRVVVTYGSYINKTSQEPNCVPASFSNFGYNRYDGVKTPGGCSNAILVSVSDNGGAGFTGGVTDPRLMQTATTAPGQATTDQWWQWAAYSRSGTFATSYYDRQFGDDETTGAMDFSLSSSGNLSSFKVTRVTSSSMPSPTQFTDAQGNSLFIGDYTGLAAWDQAFPIWADTRQVDLFLCPGGGAPTTCSGTEPNGLEANDQEIFSDSVGLR